jgi:hypothetical protein
MILSKTRPVFFLRRYRKPLIWVLVILFLWQGFPPLVCAIVDWLNKPAPLQEILDKPELSLVAQTLHLKLTDSLTRACVFAGEDEPFIGFAVRLDLDNAGFRELFGDDWVLTIQQLSKSDSRVPDIDGYYTTPFDSYGDWWDLVPAQEGDQLWERQAPDGKGSGVAIVRPKGNGYSIYIMTASFRVKDLPAGLWDKLNTQWIPDGFMPRQEGFCGGIWKKQGIASAP